MTDKLENIDTDETRFVTRRKMRELCSTEETALPTSTLATDIKLGKVLETDRDGHNLIDLQHPKNKEYVVTKIKYHELQVESSRRVDESIKRQIDIDRAREDLKIKTITRMKAEGKVIATDLVYITLRTHLREYKQQFYHAAEQISNDMIRKYGGSKKEMAEMKGNLIKVINASIIKAEQGMSAQIKSIVDEYKEATEKGRPLGS